MSKRRAAHPRGRRRLLMQLFSFLIPVACFISIVHGETNHLVHCDTTAGPLEIRLTEEWSPKGVARFLELVDDVFFDDQVLYRVVPGFLVQFGVASDPSDTKRWSESRIEDERGSNLQPFKFGSVSFAGNGRDSRSCHIFVAFEPNGVKLGKALHETPIGQVTESSLQTLETIQSTFQKAGYNDLTHLQGKLASRGNAAASDYPKLDRINYCRRADAKFECNVCGYVYDKADGDGKSFSELDDQWPCPHCGATKGAFEEKLPLFPSKDEL